MYCTDPAEIMITRRVWDLYNLYDLYDLHDLYDLYDPYDPYDLYDLCGDLSLTRVSINLFAGCPQDGKRATGADREAARRQELQRPDVQRGGRFFNRRLGREGRGEGRRVYSLIVMHDRGLQDH